MNKRILVTGGSGFIGRSLLRRLANPGPASPRYVTRHLHAIEGAEPIVLDINAQTDWALALDSVDCVVHLAARVHHMDDRSKDCLAAYREINTLGTLRLAQQAAARNVRRFIYMSTAKVYGESSGEQPFKESDRANPDDPYSISKWEAEEELRKIESSCGMELVIIRPPLVYGPGVGANFLRLMQHIASGRHLPFDAICNQRSLVGLGNLTEVIHACINHPEAAGQHFNVSDNADLSTPELIRHLARALRVEARLLRIPPGLLRIAATIMGRGTEASRLLGNFAIDSSRVREKLEWQPQPMDEELQRTAEWYWGRLRRAN